jgi:hypothetical protein
LSFSLSSLTEKRSPELKLKGKHMRYYIPMREKNVKIEKNSTSFMPPLWVWIALLAFLMLVVIALR